MRDRRLEELLRDPAAHPSDPLAPEALRAAERAVLVRFAAETAPKRRPSATRWLEFAALPLAAAALLIAGADWFGGVWTSAGEGLARAREASTTSGTGWLSDLSEAMNAQPWLVVSLAAGFALLWLPPVRAALLGHRD